MSMEQSDKIETMYNAAMTALGFDMRPIKTRIVDVVSRLNAAKANVAHFPMEKMFAHWMVAVDLVKDLQARIEALEDPIKTQAPE